MAEATAARARDVSCLALTFFYDYLQARGIDRRQLQDALPYPPEYLDHRTNWIDYPSFLAAEQRMAELLPDPELFVNIGRTFGQTNGFGFLRVLFRSVVSPHQVYARLPRLVARFLFPFVQIDFQRTDPRHLTATYSFREGFEPSDAYLGVVKGILIQIPAVMGLPAASVRMLRPSARTARFEILLPRAGESVIERLRAVPQRLVQTSRVLVSNFADAASELEETNHLLQEKVAALEEAQAERDRRLREQVLVNALLHAASEEPELMALLDRIVSTLSEAGRSSGAALLLPEGDPPRLVVAAAAGLELAEEDALAQALQPQTAAGSEPRAVELGRRRFRVVPLWARDERVGALVLEEEGVSDTAHIETIAGEVALIVRNALDLRTITDLRHNLELRVQERTAELDEAREKLQLSVEELRRSDRSRNDFFTNVSHELRTPLTLILAPLDHLQELLADDAEGTEEVRSVRRNAQHLLRQINEILDFARLEADRMPMSPVPVELRPLLADILASVQPLANRRRVALHLEVPEGIVALLDPKLGRRAFFNLVTNAIKYVNEGDEVFVRARRGDCVQVEVSDTGPGIAADQRSRIFERFQRGTEAVHRAEGSGLGLPMVHEIITRHDGQVSLEQHPGLGAVFLVTLPLPGEATVAAHPVESGDGAEDRDTVAAWLENLSCTDALGRASTPAVRSSGPTRAHVLVVEDHPEMRAFLSRLLAPHHRLTWAVDGAEGLERAREGVPDVVLSDVMMPGIDGLELCRRLKKEPVTAQVPVILISARHGTDAALDAFAAGAEDFIVKPFSAPELLARIDAQVRLRRMSAMLSAAEKQTSLGVLSAGVAHEVLNPTNAVINAVPALRKCLSRLAEEPSGERWAHCAQLLELVDRAGHRIRTIVQALLGFSRGDKGGLALRPASLRETLEESLELVAPRLSPSVKVHCDYAWDGQVMCAPDLLRQVFANLLSNAADATEHEVHVRVHQVEGGDVRVSIADDGPGVPPAMRDRIFDAFFTTKPPGEGTGLGLALSREITSIHGGRLELAQERPVGAEFVVTLPLQPKHAEEARP